MSDDDAYISLAAAPLDDYSVPDVGDERSHLYTEPPPLRALAVSSQPPALIVPFIRTLGLGSFGLDVVGAKRAIWRANGLPLGVFTRTFGPVAVRQLRAFQAAHGLALDGKLGPATLRKLGRYFDQYAFLLYTGYPPGGTAADQARRAVVAYSTWGYNNRALIHYAEYRPMVWMSDLEHLPLTEDCSTRATKAYKFGRVADPNGFGYNGYGNTGTMRQHGRLVPLAAARPGDLVHYDGPQHVAVYVGSGRVISHGSEIGPLLSPVSYRPVAQVRSYI